MSDLDVIREARDYLAGLIEKSGPDEWVAVQWKSGAGWRIDAGDDRITLDTEGGEVFHESDAHLIVALRAIAPLILNELGRAVGEMDYRPWLEPPAWAMRLSVVILATKGEKNDE